jgi:hypothetical protein
VKDAAEQLIKQSMFAHNGKDADVRIDLQIECSELYLVVTGPF